MLRARIAVTALVALSSLHAVADVVQNKERTYSVKYKDGAVERYTVKWVANVKTTLRDEGSSPIPYQGSVANPSCAWSIAPTIDRTVSLVTRLGQPFPLPGMTKSFDRDFQNPGAAFQAAGVRKESCSELRKAREGEMDSAQRAFLQSFERLTNADLESLKSEAQKHAEVVSITVQ